MITAENAHLRVKKLSGRRGPFCVGDLSTDFGDFKVKDSLLDQFEEGHYQVTAWIDHIYLGQYVAYGKAVSEIRAQLADLQVFEEKQEPAPAETFDPDPIDEAPRTPAADTAASPEAPLSNETTDDAQGARDKRWDKFKKPSKADAASAEALTQVDGNGIFDADMLVVIEHGEPIKLDATVDRAQFRAQRDALKDRGYRFESKTQTWLAH